MEKTKGAQIRAGIKWIEEGEKNTNFFLNLEKRRAENNTINRLVKRDGEIATGGSEIIKEIKSYYEELYREDKSVEMIKQKANLFSRKLKFPTLTAEQRYQTEADITEHEIKEALKSMKNGSALGPDGLLTEQYKFFWHDIMDFFFYGFSTLQPARRKIMSLSKARDNRAYP